MEDLQRKENLENRHFYKSNFYYGGTESLCEYLELAANRYGSLPAITDKYNGIELTYSQMLMETKDFACGLQGLGVKTGDIIALFSESCGRWAVVDGGILRCGAIDAVRGSNAPTDELDYIMENSGCSGVILQNVSLLNKLKSVLGKYNLKFIVLMFKDDDFDSNDIDCPVYSYEEIISSGRRRCFNKVEISKDDPFTIIYTSGTTGEPKGVLLRHESMMYQLEIAHKGFLATPGEKTLQVLPIWHAYERVGMYYYLAHGCHLFYTTLSKIKDDMIKYSPDTMMSVPRIWEAVREGIYKKIGSQSKLAEKIFNFAIKTGTIYKNNLMYVERRITDMKYYTSVGTCKSYIIAKLFEPLHKFFSRTLYKRIKAAAGLNFRATISGGGALSMKDEMFYEILGVNLRVGYGMSETSPVLTLRNVGDKNFLGSAGTPVEGTLIKIVNPETKEPLPPFEKGLVMAAGPQIMLGYFNNEEETRKIIDDNGWLNTGDLGYLTRDNNLVLLGRIKETIVLSSGENVEPVPIENACLESPYIGQMILVGQDKNAVGAIVVPAKDALERCGIDSGVLRMQKDIRIKNPELRKLIKSEINHYIKNKSKLKPFERIAKFEIIKEPFGRDNGYMTSSGKIKRNLVFEDFKEIIENLYV